MQYLSAIGSVLVVRGGAPTGKLNGRYKHGAYTFAAKSAQSQTRALIGRCNELLGSLSGE